MKLKNSFFYTVREDIKNEDSTSGNLLVRSGMIKKGSTGTYMYMPLGLKVLKNIEKVVREEMEAAGSQEMLMPSLIHQEVYEESGRNETFGSSIFRLNDRFGKPYILGPTHEEMFAIAGKMNVKSYKDLPFNLFQFQNKFRDEPRPRYGLIRVREFIMKDAYSYDLDLEGLDVSYNKMFKAYQNIFDRFELDYKIVKADTGAMGGLLSEEFQAVTEIGEDTLVLCDKCDYASNIEVSECIQQERETNEEKMPLELIETPHLKTIEELSDSLNLDASRFIKTMVYKVDDELVACLVPGNREVNETKVLKLLGGNEIELPTNEEIVNCTNGIVGFIGPINLGIRIIADKAVLKMTNAIIGANQKDYHYKNANVDIDFTYDDEADITNIQEGDVCPKCGGIVFFKKGIEVGNTFKLGTKYSEALGLQYQDQNNKFHPVVMGSYGIGIGRTMAAIVEQMHDDSGLVWPISIAPYKVYIVLINEKDEVQSELANKLYDEFNKENIDVILDNRKERAGVKFKDADLIGVPIRITVGKKASENLVEFKLRTNDELEEIESDECLDKVKAIIVKK